MVWHYCPVRLSPLTIYQSAEPLPQATVTRWRVINSPQVTLVEFGHLLTLISFDFLVASRGFFRRSILHGCFYTFLLQPERTHADGNPVEHSEKTDIFRLFCIEIPQLLCSAPDLISSTWHSLDVAATAVTCRQTDHLLFCVQPDVSHLFQWNHIIHYFFMIIRRQNQFVYLEIRLQCKTLEPFKRKLPLWEKSLDGIHIIHKSIFCFCCCVV